VMRNLWKALIVILLVVAIGVALAGKRKGRHAVGAAIPPMAQHPSAQAASPGSETAPAPASATTALPRAGSTRRAVSRRPQARPGLASTSPPGPAASAQAEAAKPKALPQLIEFGSHTCVPCQKMMPILDELRKDYAGRLEVTFYDVYQHRDKAMESRIRVIPTQLFIGPDGNEFYRHEGFFPKADILARFKEKGITLTRAR
jgi:thioredoxin 1